MGPRSPWSPPCAANAASPSGEGGEGRLEEVSVVEGYPVLVEGGAVAFPGVGSGPAFHVRSDEDLVNFPPGAVLIAKHSTPKFVVVMQKAQAIVTDAGSVTGHMASLAREFGLPTVLGTKTATFSHPTWRASHCGGIFWQEYQGKVRELIALKNRESAMKDTPVYRTRGGWPIGSCPFTW